MPYIESVSWRIYDHDREVYGPVSKTHISAVLNKTLCGIEIPIDSAFKRMSLLEPINCKRCLAKQTVAA